MKNCAECGQPVDPEKDWVGVAFTKGPPAFLHTKCYDNAMKIIKEGTPKKDQLFRGTCQSCGCVVEMARNETNVQKALEPGDDIHYVLCPTQRCRKGFKRKIYLTPYTPPEKDSTENEQSCTVASIV